MENNAYEAAIIATYVFMFIIATSITIFLFSSVYEYSNKAYEYGRNVSKDSVIVDAPITKHNILSGSEVMSYIDNYIKYDKYLTEDLYNKFINGNNLTQDEKQVINDLKKEGISIYKFKLPEQNIFYEKFYTLKYVSDNITSGIVEIEIKDITNDIK
ncbi:MAG: hypothetical protein RSE41_06700 [Clostridia bacterium]